MTQLVVVLVVLGGAITLVRRVQGSSETNVAPEAASLDLVAGADTAPATSPTAVQSLGAFTVRTLDGKTAPVAVPGEPTIIMVSSRTCGWCKRALADLGRLSKGRPLTRLTLLTLEGAAEGTPMVEKEGIRGARLVGPAGSTDQVLLTFRYPGTPTFVAVDRNGRVVSTMPGYPIGQVMEQWYAVMVGDADTP